MDPRRGVRDEDPEEGAREEIRFHLEERVRALVARGMTPEAARAEALRRFGDPEAAARRVVEEDRRLRRQRRVASLLAALRQDLILALRRLRSAPGFTLVALLTVALSLGATTSIFGVVDGILLRPLSFPEPDELVAVWVDLSAVGGPEREWHSYPNLHDLRESSTTLEALGWYVGGSGTLTGDGALPESVNFARVDRALLDGVLKVTPLHGRLFRSEEDRPEGPSAVILSHGLWVDRFGADPDLVGKSLVLDDRAIPVVGILPADFQPPFAPDARFWLPLQQDEGSHFGGRGSYTYRAIGRRAEGASLEAAQVEVRQVGARLAAAHPGSNRGLSFAVVPLREDLTAGVRTPLLLLLGAVGMVLLIGCVNVATLLLSRGSGRRGELAVRTALGGGRRRLLGQLLTENLVLALLGGAVGLAVAVLGTRLLVGLAPPGTPRVEVIGVDGRVLAFAALATLGAGLIFGILPALQASSDAAAGLRAEGRSGGADRRSGRVRSVLVVVQVALALVLLTGSGLLIRSFDNLTRVDLGFRPEGVLTFTVVYPTARYPDRDALVAAQSLLRERLEGIPGVTAAGLTSVLPLSGGGTDADFLLEGQPVPAPGEVPVTWLRQVSVGYLQSLEVRPLEGRLLEERDREGPQAVVVNETFVRRWLQGDPALGRRLTFGSPESPSWWEIVGVIPDQRGYGIRDDGVRSEAFLPLERAPARGVTATVRTEGDPEGLAPLAREAVAALDPGLAPASVRPLTGYVDAALATDRFVTLLVSLFAGVALLLAAVGLYGVVSFGVQARRREIGVRMALGAPGVRVGWTVVRWSLGLVALGVVLGAGGAAALSRGIRGILYGVEPADTPTFLWVAGVLLATALLAGAVPAARAARTDPATVLRE